MQKLAVLISMLLAFHWCPGQVRHEVNWPEDKAYLKKQLPKKHIDLFHVNRKLNSTMPLNGLIRIRFPIWQKP